MSEGSGSDNDWFGEVLRTCDAYLSRVILTDKNGGNYYTFHCIYLLMSTDYLMKCGENTRFFK
jgi:hypothetical protein